MRSLDSGENWAMVDSGLPGGTFPSYYSIGAFVASGANLFVGLEKSTGSGSIYWSTDDGTSWVEIAKNSSDFPVTSLAVSSSTLFAGTNGGGVLAFSQIDTSWKLSHVGLQDLEVNALALEGNYLFAATNEDGIFLSKDSGSNWAWSAVNSGLPCTNVTCFVAKDATLFCGTKGDGLFTSTDAGANWNPTTSEPMNARVESLIVSDTNLLLGTSSDNQIGNIYLSSDNGANWIDANPLYPNFGANGFAKIGNKLYAATSGGSMGNFGGGVLISIDNGMNWASLENGLVGADLDVSSLQVIGSNLYAMTAGGVFLLTEDGPGHAEGWVAASNAFPMINSAQTIGTSIIGASDKGILRSFDSGTTWEATGLRGVAIHWLALSGATLFAATDSGVRVSRDSGASWIFASSSMKDNPLDPTTLIVSGANLVVGTNGSSVWRHSLADLSVVTRAAHSKLSISNYPNPYTDRTTIKFSSEKSGIAEVVIVNLLGQQVAELFSGELDAGEHSFDWNAKGLPAGLYVCVVRNNGSINELPLVLVK